MCIRDRLKRTQGISCTNQISNDKVFNKKKTKVVEEHGQEETPMGEAFHYTKQLHDYDICEEINGKSSMERPNPLDKMLDR